jgi:carbonic anhydrase
MDGRLPSWEEILASAEKAAREGQKPKKVVIACSDSRVIPEYAFSAKPGEIFVIRTAGNVLDDVGYASLYYALHHLPVEEVIVLAHTHCGAVTAAFKGVEEEQLKPILDKIRPVIEGTSSLDEAILKNGEAVAREIAEKEWVKEKRPRIKLMLYDIATLEVKEIKVVM